MHSYTRDFRLWYTGLGFGALLVTLTGAVQAQPVLLTQIQGMRNDTEFVPGRPAIPWQTVAVRNLTDQGAEIALERAEAAPGTVTEPESVAYLYTPAMPRGEFVSNNNQLVTFESRLTPPLFTGWDNGCVSQGFQNQYLNAPVTLAAQASRRGANGGWLRRCQLTTDRMGLIVDEDRYRDTERQHLAEAASLMVFSRPFAARFTNAGDNWALEAGRVALVSTQGAAAAFTAVQFKQAYSEPPLVFALPGKQGGNPASVRIRNITRKGFEIVSVEPPGEDGAHIPMQADYLAVSPGRHELPGGIPIQAGTLRTTAVQGGAGVSGAKGWQRLSFDEAAAKCTIFPPDNPWNQDVSALPVHPNSAAYMASIGLNGHAHADFGTVWNGAPNGMPVVDVRDETPRRDVEFLYASESDMGPYPIPDNPPIQGGPNGTGDRHIIMLDRKACLLYELFHAWPPGAPKNRSLNPVNWYAGSGAIFDLRSNQLRPDDWTSADAAGLPIYPGLVRYEEVMEEKEIRHALRFTTRVTQRAYIHPATHFASSSTDPRLAPMGLRVRLKSDYDISGFAPEVQVILRALKKYGMLLADNGQDWFISGSPDPRWNDNNLHQFHQVPGSAFEAVYTGELITP